MGLEPLNQETPGEGVGASYLPPGAGLGPH